VKVDFELWGCPVSGPQILQVVNSLLLGVAPRDNADKVCTECKRHGYPCVLVSRGVPCMGPVTRAGCGALCPGLGRDCYGCYGPAENANTDALATEFERLGLAPQAVAQRFLSINSLAPVFLEAGNKARMKCDE
jgi:coenzyme F420-reducing hydrogenase gamma subunit